MEITKLGTAQDEGEFDRLWETGKMILTAAGYAAGGFMLAGARLFGVYLPLSASLAAAAHGRAVLYILAGAAAGGILRLDGAELVRYLAVCIGSGAASFLLDKAGFTEKRKLVLPLTVFACCLVSGVAVLFSGEPTVNGFLQYSCDSLLGGGAVFLYMGALYGIERREGLAMLDKKSLVCLIISLCSLLLSVSDISLFGIHPARIAGSLTLLAAAYLFAEPGGSMAGICVGTCFAATGTAGILSVCYSVCGLTSGIFSAHGRLASAAAFSVTAALAAIIDGSAQGLAMLAESAAAAIIFMLIPSSRLEKVKAHLMQPAALRIQSGLETAPDRLLDASAAVGSVADCIRTVSRGIEALSPTRDSILRLRVYERVCADCPLNDNGCPENGEFAAVTEKLRGGETVGVDDFTAEFTAICPNALFVADAFNKVFRSRATLSALEAANARSRELSCCQFDSVSALLGELSASLRGESQILFEKEKTALRVLRENGLSVDNLRCSQPPDGAMRLEAGVKDVLPGLSLSRLTRQLSSELALELSPPELSEVPEGARLCFTGKERFAVRLGCAGCACADERLCGDYYEFFRSDSHAYIFLSDGMGTGGRAAVDSAMTVELFSRLLHAGLSMQTALDMTSCALTVKSGDESLSTLDVAEINLFTGEAVIYKAGAAASFLKCSGRARQIQVSSSPLGILPKPQFSKTQILLHGGDTLLMLSDGILGCGSEWVVDELHAFDGSDASAFAEKILEKAKIKCGKRYDDMTVIAAVLEHL